MSAVASEAMKTWKKDHDDNDDDDDDNDDDGDDDGDADDCSDNKTFFSKAVLQLE